MTHRRAGPTSHSAFSVHLLHYLTICKINRSCLHRLDYLPQPSQQPVQRSVADQVLLLLSKHVLAVYALSCVRFCPQQSGLENISGFGVTMPLQCYNVTSV